VTIRPTSLLNRFTIVSDKHRSSEPSDSGNRGVYNQPRGVNV
jgi:hypothetical protein